MKECYSLAMEERPSSEDIVKEMKSEHFLLLHDSITLDRNSEKHDSIATDRSSEENLEITCVYVCQTNGRWKIWISESGQSSSRCISVYDIESSRFSVYRKDYPGPPIIGMAKVGFRIWIINKENNCLNIIERGHESSFEISSGASLDSRATKILNHSYGSLEESKSIILVGLENGCLTMFHFSASNNTSVTAISNISIEINVPVADMCSCRDDLLTVACGMTVYFQQVGLPDNQGINETKISKGTWIPKLIPSGSVSLTNVIDGYHPVAAITADGNTVWCCLEGCSLVLKVDSDLEQVVLVLTISWNSVLDTVRIEEGKTLPESSVMLGASGSGVVSEALKINQHEISVDNDNDPETNDQKVYNEIDSDLGRGSKSITLPRRYTTITVPKLPPGRNILEKAISMPELDTTPPFLPKRRGYQNVNISITSLRLATDILVIGTTGGAIVLLPLTYSTKSGTSGNPPSLPFLLPVLKHSGARKSGQGLATTESISTLMSASDKLVSLYSTHSHVLRHRQSTRSDSYIKRRGVFLNPESLSNSQCHSGTDTSDTRRIREGGFFNSESNSHCHSGTETNNINTSASSHIVPSQPTSSSSTASAMDLRPNVCDIAVWDTVTCNRLKTIRSYGHSLIDCSGWCCRAPVPVSDT